MKFDLPKDLNKFDFYCEKYREHVGIVELTKKSKPRTLRQNRYLHSLIAIFGIELGYNLEESKTILKRKCPFMVYEKNGHLFARSSKNLDTAEMSKWIEWIRNYAGQEGIYLPTADEYLRDWTEIEKTIEANSTFL